MLISGCLIVDFTAIEDDEAKYELQTILVEIGTTSQNYVNTDRELCFGKLLICSTKKDIWRCCVKPAQTKGTMWMFHR